MCAGTWEKVGDKGAGSCPFIKRWGGTAADVPAFLGGTADCPPELVARDGVLAGLTKLRLVKIALVKTAQVRGGRHIRRPRRLHTPVDACQSECRVRSQVTVGARSKEVVPFMVPAEQCEAKWELVVEDFGIGIKPVNVYDYQAGLRDLARHLYADQASRFNLGRPGGNLLDVPLFALKDAHGLMSGPPCPPLVAVRVA